MFYFFKFIYSTLNIIDFFNELAEDKISVLQMQKEVSETAKNIVCLIFKCKKQSKINDKFYNIVELSCNKFNNTITNQIFEIGFISNNYINKNIQVYEFFLCFIDFNYNLYCNYNFLNENMVKETKILDKSVFESYLNILSNIILFKNCKLTRNEYIYILKEFKTKFKLKILKNEQAIIFLLKDEKNNPNDYNFNLKRKLNEILINCGNYLNEVFVLYNRKDIYSKTNTWDIGFMYDKYTNTFNDSKNNFDYEYKGLHYNQNRKFTYNTLYFDFYFDFDNIKNLEKEVYEKVKKFLSKKSSNDFYLLKIESTFGNNLLVYFILYRKKIFKDLYKETIKAISEDKNSLFLLFKYSYYVNIKNEGENDEDISVPFNLNKELTFENVKKFFDSDDPDVSDYEISDDECNFCYERKYGKILEREIFYFENINQNYYIGNFLTENNFLNFNSKKKLFFYINNKQDLIKYNEIVLKYENFKNNFYRIYTLNNNTENSLIEVKTFLNNLKLIKNVLINKTKTFKLPIFNLLNENLYFYTFENVIIVDNKYFDSCNLVKKIYDILQNLNKKYENICCFESAKPKLSLSADKCIESADDTIKIFYLQYDNIVLSVRSSLCLNDQTFTLQINSFEPNETKFIDFCKTSYDMAVTTISNYVCLIYNNHKNLFVTEIFSYVLENILNFYPKNEFYALYYNFEYFKGYINILIKLNLLKFEYINRCYKSGEFKNLKDSNQIHEIILEEYLNDQILKNTINATCEDINFNNKTIFSVISSRFIDEILLKEIIILDKYVKLNRYNVYNDVKYKNDSFIDDLKFNSFVSIIHHTLKNYFTVNFASFLRNQSENNNLFVFSFISKQSNCSKFEKFHDEVMNFIASDLINT